MDWIILFNNQNNFSREISLFKPDVYSGILLIIDGKPLIIDAITGLKCPKGTYNIKGIAYKSSKSLQPILEQIPKEINLEKLSVYLIDNGPFTTGYDIVNNFFIKKYYNSSTIHMNRDITNPLPIPLIYNVIEYNSDSVLPEINVLHKFIVEGLLCLPRPKVSSKSLSRLKMALLKLPPEVLHLYEIDLAFNQIASETDVPCMSIPPTPNKSDLIRIINQVHPSLTEALEREINKRK